MKELVKSYKISIILINNANSLLQLTINLYFLCKPLAGTHAMINMREQNRWAAVSKVCKVRALFLLCLFEDTAENPVIGGRLFSGLHH